MGESRDPRKREEQRRAGEALTKPMYWQPFRHNVCGCYLEWGAPVPNSDRRTADLAYREMVRFLRTVAPYPCPMHGSATGVPSPQLQGREMRYMPACNAWYRALPDERRVYADRLADHIASGSGD